jgi:magnesium chelatase subunit I
MQFPLITKVVKRIVEEIKRKQLDFRELAKHYGIKNNLEYIEFKKEFENLSETDNPGIRDAEELWASATELLLEYLRFTSPPILEKREDTFESSNSNV